jgi:hypothetical protein
MGNNQGMKTQRPLRLPAIIVLVALCCLGNPKIEAKDLILVEHGRPRATIVVAAQTNDKVKVAAEELQAYLEKISGAKLPMVTDQQEPSGTLILVGRSKLTEAIEVEIPAGITHERVEEGFVILCHGDRLVLAGNNDGPYHGTEYAVYEFLNRLGVRWFMPGEFGEYVPKQATIQFPEMKVAEKPDFIMRDWWITGWWPQDDLMQQEARWKLRNKMNFVGHDQMWWIPTDGCIFPEDLVKEHPEYFARKADGTRDARLNDLSNPKVFAAAVDLVKDYFRKNPMANSYAIAAGDGYPRDFSPETVKRSLNLREIMSRPGVAEELNISQEFFQFVNQLTVEVRKEFPRVYISTFAYANRVIPPQGMELDDHLLVQFALLPVCKLHDVENPRCWHAVRQAQMLKRWCELCPGRVWLYDYLYKMQITGLTPLPETRKLKRNFPLWKKWGLIGFHDEGRIVWAELGIASRYVRSRLEWNAHADVEAILDDFYAKWYGKAAKPMHRFYDAIEDAIEKAPLHLHEDQIMPLVYTPQMMRILKTQMATAEKLADSDRATLHVRADRLIYEHLRDYLALDAAAAAGDWAGAVRHAEHTMEVRKQLHAISPFFIWPDENPKDGVTSGIFDWGATYRGAFYQKLVDKTSGKIGDLVALLPQTALARTDVHDDGWFEEWYQPDWQDTGWERVETTKPFYFQGHTDAQGHPYDGLIWYRLSVDVPALAKGKKIMVYAPVVECEAWGWCNGQFVGHRPFMEAWNHPTPMEFDVTAAIKPGQRNQFTFRVSAGFMRAFPGAGFQSRLMLYSPKQETGAEKNAGPGILYSPEQETISEKR